MGAPDAWGGGQVQDVLHAGTHALQDQAQSGPAQSHKNNPEAIGAFQASCRDHLQQLIPPANTRPLRVLSQDESRFGLLTVRRRRLTARGVPPVGSVQHVFAWFDVYGAVAPATGDRFFLELPSLNAENFHICIHLFAQAFPDSLNLLLLDKRGAHTAQQLTISVNVGLVCLPPYCPELNPIERVWRDLKVALAWLQFPTLEAQQDYLATLLQGYTAVTLQSLTGYTSLVEAIHALSLYSGYAALRNRSKAGSTPARPLKLSYCVSLSMLS
jgi:putative transposase